ncbi:MAG TPA: SPOR domain-containing protein [Chitinophagaceae bacterium]|nr:SPOR domain-containing protein [Chitinophagaceae bacterium]
MKFFIIGAFFFCCLNSLAQTPPQAGNAAVMQTATSVVVHKDPRIDLLVKKKAAINKITKNGAHTMRGYRLLVLNTNKRDEAIAAKTKVYTYFPELKSYLQYQSPYFKLRAGNFKTRDEAEKYRKSMTSMFPKGVFIVGDIIEIKAEKERENMEE